MKRMDAPSPRSTLFVTEALQCIELRIDDMPALQRFFQDNPEYFHSVNGQTPGPDEALNEFDDVPPPGMPFSRKWLLGFVDDAGRLWAMANVLSDFLAPRVWHIGLFILASTRHGTTAAQSIYRDLERWMIGNGARWVRLGVVQGNPKAERFWSKVGYTQVRERTGVPMGERVNALRVMVKPLAADASLLQYLEIVARDRPETG
jgi:hypothetical protein